MGDISLVKSSHFLTNKLRNLQQHFETQKSKIEKAKEKICSTEDSIKSVKVRSFRIQYQFVNL